MKSSPENPFLFTFDGKIPSLKNGKMWVWDEGATKPKVFSDKEVKNWYADQVEPLTQQREAQADLDNIECAYCRFELFAKGSRSSLDVDNVYTTVQELLQPADKNEGILGLIRDDKDVIGFSSWTYPITDIRSAYLWVWESGPERNDIEDLVTFAAHRADNLKKRLKKKTLSLARYR